MGNIIDRLHSPLTRYFSRSWSALKELSHKLTTLQRGWESFRNTKNYLKISYLCVIGSPWDFFVAVKVIGPGPYITPKDSGHRKGGREEPDERDVNGVCPWAGNCAFFTGKVPLAVFHKKVPRQEEEGQRQEEKEAVVKVAVADTVNIPIVPGHIDHLSKKNQKLLKNH